ncbi:SHOCT domain-containing protein [Kitasatospora sp. RG8]|uniref:SHOCT domain-containing protein n=1 Tax=Kitasatospora sp. RG8 TaxID=2820815 RepID=UPI001ADF25A2|nr:SHOCT domain-containing protein [Kitasatospora sp. RG8]MBP0447962.1 SHOCT domain-containing protein [Kitasatospora sp. RG8]
MFRPLRPIRPVRVMRPVGAPLVRGLVVGGAAYAAGRGAADRRRGEQDQNEAIAALQAQLAAPAGTAAPAVAVVAAAQPGPAASAVPTASGLPAVPIASAASGLPAASAGAPDLADKLADLGRMAQQGLLTPEEFATAKARLLGG